MKFDRWTGAAVAEQRKTVEAIFRAAYAKAIASGDPFEQPEPFMKRFDAYARIPGIDLVQTTLSEPVAQAWGWPLSAGTGWWRGLLPGSQLDTIEDGQRTFALSEIMVAETYGGHGIARATHDELLRERPEERATLLVDPANARADHIYRSWGWRKVGQLQPAWPDSPRYDVLILPLSPAQNTRLGSPSRALY